MDVEIASCSKIQSWRIRKGKLAGDVIQCVIRVWHQLTSCTVVTANSGGANQLQPGGMSKKYTFLIENSQKNIFAFRAYNYINVFNIL